MALPTEGLLNVAMGGNTRVAFLVQAAAGAIDTNPAWTVLPVLSVDTNVNANPLDDNSLTGDRNMIKPRLGTVDAQVNLTLHPRPGVIDDFLEAALQGTWGPKYTAAGLTVSVNATNKTFTRSTGSWIDLGVEIGDNVTFSGFGGGLTGNNGTFLVSNVSPLAITCSTATGLADATDSTGIGVTTPSDWLRVGKDRRKFAVEIFQSDAAGGAGEYQRFIDLEVANLGFSFDPEGSTQMTVSMIGGTELDLGEDIGAEIAGATYTETSKAMYSSFNGGLWIDGNEAVILSSIEPKFDNDSRSLFVIGRRYPAAVSHGKMNGDMTATAYYLDAEWYQKYKSQEAITLKLVLANSDTSTDDQHHLIFPAAQIIEYARPISGPAEIAQNLTIRPFKSSVFGTSVLVRRQIAA